MSLPNRPISNRAVSLWSLLNAIEGFTTVYFLVKEPSETENVLAFGLSLERLIIVVGVLVLALAFTMITFAHYYRLFSWHEKINSRPTIIRYFLAGTFILELAILQILFLLPGYHFPVLSGYLSRLQPILIWLALFLGQTFVFLAYFGGLTFENLKEFRNNKPVLIAFVIFLLVWGVIAKTQLGITPDKFFWHMVGVPLLAGQVWLAIVITSIGWLIWNQFIARRNNNSDRSSFLIFMGIWIITALIWVNTPLAPTFNAPGPYLPSKGFYPFVDAALYDLSAQSAIYGRGINFGGFVDRGLLLGFLALLHRLFGQNYLVIVGVQSAIFAVFPALLYLLGERLHSKSAGLIAATLALFNVVNAIRGGKLISTSHPKLLLTEFPTGIILVLFSIFLVKWLARSKSNSYTLLSIGASIGIGILLRQNVFFMVLVAFGLGLIGRWKLNWKLALRDNSLIIVSFFVVISPWMWRNQRIAGEPLFFLPQFNSVIEQRYQPQSNLDQDRPVSLPPSRALKTNATIARIEKNNIFDQFQFIPMHFAHNVITSVLILPPSPVLDDLRHVVDKYPYWNRLPSMGLGQISATTGIFLALNLLILSIGLGAAWKRVKYAALVPVTVLLFYSLANAFARTSGGRYIVPIDWTIYFYYAIGLVEILSFCISMVGFTPGTFFAESFNKALNDDDKKFKWGKAGLTILPFFLIVAALPAIELASPGDQPVPTTDMLMQRLDETSFFANSGLSRLALEEFLSDPNAILISGRGLYPRYYSYEQGEPILPDQMTAYTARDFPRLVFSLLLPTADKPVVLPLDDPDIYFPDAGEVIVGGCLVGKSDVPILTSYLEYIDAAFVVILDKPDTTYVRMPTAPLVCPLRVPVCDNNHNCK